MLNQRAFLQASRHSECRVFCWPEHIQKN